MSDLKQDNDLNNVPDNQQVSDVNLSQQKKENQPISNESNPQEVSEDPNWKAFREARKRDRAEKEEAERKAMEKEKEVEALKAAMEAAFSKSTIQSPQSYYSQNESIEETEDEKIEKKVNQILAAKEEQLRREREQRERAEYPQKLMRDFPDINQVCSQENLDYLDYHYPELSRPLQRLSDGYDKWSDIYHAVKKFIPSYATAKKESIKAEMNNQKPKSISSTSLSQSGESSNQTWQDIEKRRAANWERMNRLIKGI